MSTKEQVLGLLEKNKGESLSGEYIAELLSISRSAVWKAVRQLEKEGYKIEAVPNKGYSLLNVNDIISLQGLAALLPLKLCEGKIHIFKTLESTNKTAKEMAISNAEHGTIVITETQTAGRGRFGRSFYSPSGGGLYISFVLKPEIINFTTPETVTVYAAVCVCRVIENICGLKAGIKWVNDIFYEGKKVCGILTEGVTDLESQSMQWLALGIGINIYTPTGGFPDNIKNTAGALYHEGYTPPVKNKIAAALIKEIMNTPKNEAHIFDEYKNRLIMLSKTISVTSKDGVYSAKAVGVTNRGHLIVKKDNGDTLELFSGEISIKV